MTPTQICKTCLIEKPLSRDFFYTNPSMKNGFAPRCIKCRTGKDRQWYPKTVDHDTHRKNWRTARRQTLYGYLADSLHNSKYATNLKRWGMVSDLTVAYLLALWVLQEGKCYWTGIPLAFGDTLAKQHPQKVSIDRLNNAIGYSKGNVVLASNFANMGRGETNGDYFAGFLLQLGITGNHPTPLVYRETVNEAAVPVCSVEKTCRTCKTAKPANTFYYHRRATSKDGFMNECIRCRTGKDRQWEYSTLEKNILQKNTRIRRRNTVAGYIGDILGNTTYARHRKKWDTLCDLTISNVVEQFNKQNGKCHWTGLPLLYGEGVSTLQLQRLSLDRLDTTRGYELNNIVLATNFANRGRGNLPPQLFSEFLTQIGISWVNDCNAI